VYSEARHFVEGGFNNRLPFFVQDILTFFKLYRNNNSRIKKLNVSRVIKERLGMRNRVVPRILLRCFKIAVTDFVLFSLTSVLSELHIIFDVLQHASGRKYETDRKFTFYIHILGSEERENE
jgi:hypothetical protein